MHPLAQIRAALGYTQADLANVLKCSQGNIGHIEARIQTLTPKYAMAIIRHAKDRGLNLTLDHVYGLKPLPKSIAKV
jgi:DNA-binding XRE family transcriptional regulator